MRLFLVHLLLVCLLLPAEASTGAEVQRRIDADLASGEPVVVHVVVALCDNRYQGIVPVPAELGNGQEPGSNLYWGALYGVRTHLGRKAGWTRVQLRTKPAEGILERLVLRKTITRFGSEHAVYVVADAWDGRRIRTATEQFLEMAAGHRRQSITIHRKDEPALTLRAGGAAALVAYVGHDGLMDFELAVTPEAAPETPPRSSLVLACDSRGYFAGPLRAGGSHPLLLTTGLMAPEAYTLDAVIAVWAAGGEAAEVREAAADAYHRYQQCGLQAARRLFAVAP